MAAGRRAAAAALLLACSSLAYAGVVLDTPAAFLEANSDEYQCMWALLERTGLTDALASSDLSNTYFLPSDAAFITDLAQSVSTDAAGADLTVEQVVAMIDAMPGDAAVQLLKAHVSPTNYPSVSALAFPSGVPAAAADPFGDTPTQPTIKNSLGQDVSVVYEAPYHALHLDVPGPNGLIASSAYVAGPAAVNTGDSTVYILLNVLGDPTLITNSGVAAQAVNSTAQAGGDDSWLH
ncbi:hypothetical protein ABPG75_009846 [Micractinium tetrahymenae]